MNILDRLIGEEGIKTDIRVSIHPSNYVYLGVALFVGVVASNIVVKQLFK